MNTDKVIERLIRELGDKDVYVHLAAEKALSGYSGPGVIEPLIEALGNENDSIHMSAAALLSKLLDPHAIGLLIKTLDNGNDYTRFYAVNLLGESKDPHALEPLIKALDDNSPNVRKAAVRALGTVKDAHFVELFIKALDDSGSEVRKEAIKALTEFNDPCIGELLIKTLSDKSKSVRKAAAAALGQIKDSRAAGPLIGLLADGEPDVRKAAAAALARLGEKKWKKLIKGDAGDFARLSQSDALPKGLRTEGFGPAEPQGKAPDSSNKNVQDISARPDYGSLEKAAKNGDFKEQYKVLDALKGDCSPESVSILTWLVFNGDHDEGIVMVKGDVRCSAIAGLAGIGGKQALSVLERAAKSGEPSIRNDAEYYLAELKKNNADEKELLKSIDSSPESSFEALAERRSPAGAKKAIEMLDSVNIDTVVAAARYLGHLRIDAATDKLIELINSGYIDIKHTAAIALGRIGGKKAKEALIRALHYPFDKFHGSHEWAISGAVKGLAIMWANGETDVKEYVKEIKVNLDCNCSRDSYKEKQSHIDLTREMFND